MHAAHNARDDRAPQEPILTSCPESRSAFALPVSLPSECANRSPLLGESQEAVDLPGVQLFMHIFDDAMKSAPLRSSKFTIDSGCGTREDRHAVREIWFVSQGQLEVFYDGVCHRVLAGQGVYFDAWKPHFTRNVGEVPAQIFSVWWGE